VPLHTLAQIATATASTSDRTNRASRARPSLHDVQHEHDECSTTKDWPAASRATAALNVTQRNTTG